MFVMGEQTSLVARRSYLAIKRTSFVSRISYFVKKLTYLVSRISYLAKKILLSSFVPHLYPLKKYEIRNTKHECCPFFPNNEIRDTKYEIRSSPGFTLLAMVGILAVMTILAAVFAPNLVSLNDRLSTDQELQSLSGIAEGTELYLRRNRAWAPTLAAHSPEYVPLDSAQLLQNPRGFPRYYAAHPTTATFNNGAGLAASDLIALRFLLVSNLSQDAAPTITNATEFETWWATDETATPDLKIYRGNLASLFHQVNLTFLGPGASYQIDGTTTDSSGGTLTDYNQYHVAGTVVSLDEDTPYGTPEIEFALTTNVSYQFDPCRSIGDRWVVAPLPAAPCEVLWLTTASDTSGIPEIGSWGEDEIVSFDNPNLSFETSPPGGTTAGQYGAIFKLENFTGQADIDAIHYVSRNLTVGSLITLDLYRGDLLLSTQGDETLNSTNSLSVDDNDVFIFRPDQPGDYSSGTFIMFFDASDVGFGSTQGVSLVEQDTFVGDTTLQAGTLLLSETSEDLYLFTPLRMGTLTVGTTQLLLDGSDFNLSQDITGIELIESERTIGGTTLLAGQILVTLDADDSSVGDNSIATEREDIFILDVTKTELGLLSFQSEANAYLFFDGSDVSLDGIDLNGIGMYLSE